MLIFFCLAFLAALFPADAADVTTNATQAPAILPAAAAQTNAAIEKEYDTLLSDDDEVQAEVDKWIRDNNEFKLKGAGIPDVDLNRRIADRFEPIQKRYEDFVRRYPAHARARLAYGSFLRDRGEEAGAQAQWEKALELDPTNPAAYNNLAGSYSENGPSKKAFEYFNKAIELKPSEALYYHNFANSMYVLRKSAMNFYNLTEQQVYLKTLQLYSNAVRLDPQNFPFASDLAQTYYAIKPFPAQDALKAWTNALQLAHDDLEREGVYVHLARLKMVDGRNDEARALLKSVTNENYFSLKTNLFNSMAEREKQAKGTNAPPAKTETKP
jgi:tetratricopeptide (TPR) repeat protein